VGGISVLTGAVRGTTELIRTVCRIFDLTGLWMEHCRSHQAVGGTLDLTRAVGGTLDITRAVGGTLHSNPGCV
jgi:hypothetical protein